MEIQYYGKAIVVTGDTAPLADKFKANKGNFNKNLPIGPGWVFSLDHAEDVKKLVAAASRGLVGLKAPAPSPKTAKTAPKKPSEVIPIHLDNSRYISVPQQVVKDIVPLPFFDQRIKVTLFEDPNTPNREVFFRIVEFEDAFPVRSFDAIVEDKIGTDEDPVAAHQFVLLDGRWQPAQSIGKFNTVEFYPPPEGVPPTTARAGRPSKAIPFPSRR